MPLLSDIAAFIFDMDGLVLDTEPTYHAAWHAALTQMNFDIKHDKIKSLSGLSYQDVLANLQYWCGGRLNIDQFKQLSAEIWQAQVAINGIKVNEGVTELLDFAQAHAMPVALATNSVATYALKCLNLAGISEKFPVMVTANDVTTLKPAPDIFQLAAKRLAVDINLCVVFEDSYPGIAAAKAAGAYTVYIPSIMPANSEALALCDLIFSNLTQFLAYLCALPVDEI